MGKAMVALLAAALECPTLSGAILEGVAVPDEVTVAGSTLHLDGVGPRRKIEFKIYVAGLCLESSTSGAATALTAGGVERVVMCDLSDKASEKRMDEGWVEGFGADSRADAKGLADRVRTFIGSFGDMKGVEVFECTVIPGTGTVVSFNGSESGTTDGGGLRRHPAPHPARSEPAVRGPRERAAWSRQISSSLTAR